MRKIICIGCNPIRIWARQRGRSRLIADVVRKIRGRFSRDSQQICGRNVRFWERSSAADHGRSPPKPHARSREACRGHEIATAKKIRPVAALHPYKYINLYTYMSYHPYIYINLYTHMSFKAATGRVISGHEKAMHTYILKKNPLISIQNEK